MLTEALNSFTVTSGLFLYFKKIILEAEKYIQYKKSIAVRCSRGFCLMSFTLLIPSSGVREVVKE